MIFRFNQKTESILLAIFSLILIMFVLYYSTSRTYSQHYSVLAYSLLQGHYDLQGEFREKYLDTSSYNGKYYFSADPGTAVLLLPLAFVYDWFNEIPPQWLLNLLLIFASSLFINKILLTKKINAISRVWFLLTFFFATSVVSIIFVPNTWNLAQTTALSLSLWFLSEQLGKRRLPIIIGLIFFMAFTRKQIVLPMVIFSISSIANNLFSQETKRKKPLLIAGGLIVISSILAVNIQKAWYISNFGGQKLTQLTNSYIIPRHSVLFEKYGQFNFHYLPRNLYIYLFKSPAPIRSTDIPGSGLTWPFLTPEQDGIGFFFLAPIFLSIFFLKSPTIFQSLPSILASFSLIFLYMIFFTSGEEQFGLRYSADIMPFAFLFLVDHLKNSVSVKIKTVIMLSIIFNCYLLFAFFASGRTL